MANDKRIRRKVMRSYIISTITISLVLFMVGVVSYVTLSAISSARTLKESVVVSVEVSDDITAECRAALELMFEDKERCADYKYVTKEEKVADEAFRKQFEIDLDLLLGENPLYDSYEVSLNVEHSDRDSVEEIANSLRNMAGVEYVSVPPVEIVEGMHKTIKQTSIALMLFLGLLLLISLLLLSNTIRLVVYSKRYLINSMKLVGATKWYIMRPFLISAIKQGFIAGILASAMMAGVVYGAESLAINGIKMLTIEEVAIVVGAIVALGVVVTVLFSAVAVNKFVNMRTNKIYLY